MFTVITNELKMLMHIDRGWKGNAKIKSILWQGDGLFFFLRNVFNDFIMFVQQQKTLMSWVETHNTKYKRCSHSGINSSCSCWSPWEKCSLVDHVWPWPVLVMVTIEIDRKREEREPPLHWTVLLIACYCSILNADCSPHLHFIGLCLQVRIN